MKKGLDESVSHMDDGDSKAKSSKETPHIFQVWKLPFKPIKSTIGDKIVETLYSNRASSENHKKSAPLPPPLHSKLGCLLFSMGSSNSGIQSTEELQFMLLIKSFFGPVKMTLGLVYASYSLTKTASCKTDSLCSLQFV